MASAITSHAKSRNLTCPLSVMSFVILIIIITCLTNLAESNPNPLPSRFSKFSRGATTVPTMDYSICNGIPYRSACESVVMSMKEERNSRMTPEDLYDHSIRVSLNQVDSALAQLSSNLSQSYHKIVTPMAVGGTTDCIELLEDSSYLLSNVINTKNEPEDVQTWLSAALTNQETCLESLANDKTQVEKHMPMFAMALNLTQIISNTLALYMSNSKSGHKLKQHTGGSGGRKLLNARGSIFPSWVNDRERKLLEASAGEISIIAHAVVAKDGRGTHKSIGDAIRLITASMSAGGRSVIYVKAGTYHENIKITTKQKNVMLVGDGKGKSIIVGDKNAEAGSSTFQSATVGAMGDGFIARDITFVNSAGPDKNQAVALRVGSDKSVIFRCSILGYQDTLYTLSKRQFYRDTDIYGTVDFIFGNSAVVFQNCNIYARKPLSGQKNYVTAQGRSDENQNTGISIHNCRIVAASDLAGSNSRITYLGRPWKQYSRTVIMQSFLDNSINPSGWSPWSGSFALSTLYYGEYMNSGPGASTSGRVHWAGYRGTLSADEAQEFTVGSFIGGNLWLPSTGVSFDSGLIG
ncbi:hypothetical protein K2173_015540 [Erythroxylum novogranatense]|uniref:Pectinesterase n=1 Tax=Erythroxylum novogranatense TaxID=1862640 RepID=A0AAV8SSV2_9ROSI|nr:hypothetical protein K2173_015540 [Erythroxylum novogranatense]